MESRSTDTNEDALKETEEQLKRDSVTLFQPAVFSKGKFVRIDILRKDGSKFELIEVKSKSFDPAKLNECGGDSTKYFEKAEWSEYVEDVAFQKHVLQERLPKAQIESYLLLPDKSKKTAIEGMIGWFKLLKDAGDTGSWRPRVEFTGDGELVCKNSFLTLVGVDEIVDRTIPLILEDVDLYASSVMSEERLKAAVSIKCRDCEYKDTDEEHPKSGFAVCWGNRAEASPHILTLGQLGNINRTRTVSTSSSLKASPACRMFRKALSGTSTTIGPSTRLQRRTSFCFLSSARSSRASSTHCTSLTSKLP